MKLHSVAVILQTRNMPKMKTNGHRKNLMQFYFRHAVIWSCQCRLIYRCRYQRTCRARTKAADIISCKFINTMKTPFHFWWFWLNSLRGHGQKYFHIQSLAVQNKMFTQQLMLIEISLWKDKSSILAEDGKVRKRGFCALFHKYYKSKMDRQENMENVKKLVIWWRY